jgi:hypothetical protein
MAEFGLREVFRRSNAAPALLADAGTIFGRIPHVILGTGSMGGGSGEKSHLRTRCVERPKRQAARHHRPGPCRRLTFLPTATISLSHRMSRLQQYLLFGKGRAARPSDHKTLPRREDVEWLVSLRLSDCKRTTVQKPCRLVRRLAETRASSLWCHFLRIRHR